MKTKKRPFTKAEREEVYNIRAAGRRGTVTVQQLDRARKLFAVNPEEYGIIGRQAATDVDALMRKGIA